MSCRGKNMWIEAIVTRDDLHRVIGECCPLRISLGGGGSLLLSDPRDLVLEAGVGMRLAVTVEIHWPVLGIQLPVSVRTAVLEVMPAISEKTGGSLSFKLHLDEVDVSVLPEFVDRGIVDLVNKELEAKHVELSWSFLKTLSHVFELPDALVSARAVDVRASWGSVKITSEALVLAVSFDVRIQPRGSEPGPSTAPLARVAPALEEKRTALEPGTLRHLWRRSATGLALISGAVLFTGIALTAFVMSLRRPGRSLQVLSERLGT
jgi:hypothetical protein